MLSKIILAATLVTPIITSTTSTEDRPLPQATVMASESDCPALANLARTIMELRMLGESKSDLLETLNLPADKFPSPVAVPETINLFKALVEAAFIMPRFSEQRKQQIAMYQFGEEVERACTERKPKL